MRKQKYVTGVEIMIRCEDFEKAGVDTVENWIKKMSKEQYQRIYDFIEKEVGPKN